MLVIRYADAPLALVTRAGIHLFLRGRGGTEPSTGWITCMAVLAHDVLQGRLPGPYTRDRAEHFARHVLMPNHDFRAVAQLSDKDIAAVFDVPVKQVEQKRLDLWALEWLAARD